LYSKISPNISFQNVFFPLKVFELRLNDMICVVGVDCQFMVIANVIVLFLLLFICPFVCLLMTI